MLPQLAELIKKQALHVRELSEEARQLSSEIQKARSTVIQQQEPPPRAPHTVATVSKTAMQPAVQPVVQPPASQHNLALVSGLLQAMQKQQAVASLQAAVQQQAVQAAVQQQQAVQAAVQQQAVQAAVQQQAALRQQQANVLMSVLTSGTPQQRAELLQLLQQPPG